MFCPPSQWCSQRRCKTVGSCTSLFVPSAWNGSKGEALHTMGRLPEKLNALHHLQLCHPFPFWSFSHPACQMCPSVAADSTPMKSTTVTNSVAFRVWVSISVR